MASVVNEDTVTRLMEITGEKSREKVVQILVMCLNNEELATDLLMDIQDDPHTTDNNQPRPGGVMDLPCTVREVEQSEPTSVVVGSLASGFVIKTEVQEDHEYVEEPGPSRSYPRPRFREALDHDHAMPEGYLLVRVLHPLSGSTEMHFRIKFTTQLGKLKKCYSERIGVPLYILRFLYEGRRFPDDVTPNDLEMESGDAIDVYEELGGAKYNEVPPPTVLYKEPRRVSTEGSERTTGQKRSSISQRTSSTEGSDYVAGQKRSSITLTNEQGHSTDAPGPSSDLGASGPSANKKPRDDAVVAPPDADIKEKENVDASEAVIELERLKKKYNDLVQKLRDKVECPVCLEIPKRAPIPICSNGHVVCNSCLRDSCPTCRSPMTATSILAVTIVDNIEHKCEWEGCIQTFPLPELPTHSRKCDFRKVSCPGLYCAQKFALSCLLDHTLQCCVHDRIVQYKGMPQKFIFTLPEDSPAAEERDLFWRLSGVGFDGEIFFLKVFRSLGSWYFLVQMLAGEEKCAQYTINMVVNQGNWSPDEARCNYSRGYTGDVCPIDISKFQEAEQKDLCLKLTDKLMQKILVKNTQTGTFELSVLLNIVRNA